MLKLIRIAKLMKQLRKQVASRANSRRLAMSIGGSLATAVVFGILALLDVPPDQAGEMAVWLYSITGGYVGSQSIVDAVGGLRGLPDEHKWFSRKFWSTVGIKLLTAILVPSAVAAGMDPETVVDLLAMLASAFNLGFLAPFTATDAISKFGPRNLSTTTKETLEHAGMSNTGEAITARTIETRVQIHPYQQDESSE